MGGSRLTFDPGTAARVKLVGLDVDGVMTDGMVYLGQQGDQEVELKRFDIRDSLGIKFLRSAGIDVIWISGRFSHATTIRARQLGVTDVIQDDAAVKLEPFDTALDRYGVSWEEAAFMGDDLPDLPVLRRVGLAVTVADAASDVLAEVQHVTERAGGDGAVREFAEALLRARGEWSDILSQYLEQRGEQVAELSNA